MTYFDNISTIKFEGPATDNLFAFRHYNPEKIVEGKTMKEHLRLL